MSVVIQTEKLSKIYESSFGGQDVHAVKELDLAINAGEIFAYLGPNGSGKTTTIKMLLGMIFPTSGSIEILGERKIYTAKVKKDIGYLPEGAYYPDFLRGEEILRYYGKLYGLSGKDLEMRIDNVLDEVGMTHARKRLLRGYSKGMRQRIGLAQALISDPRILILDEPTTGLDPIARIEIRDILARLRDQGKTLLISSHELLEVELICDRVGILHEGALQRLGTIDDLLEMRALTFEALNPNEAALNALKERGITASDKVANQITLTLPSGMSIYEAMEVCKQHDVQLHRIAPQRETLEELFVRVVTDAKAGRS